MRSKTKSQHGNSNLEEFNDFHEKPGDNSRPPINIENLSYRLKGETEQHPVKELEGKMECPFCKIAAKNLHIHLSRKRECGDKIDMDHFSSKFENYKKNLRKVKNSEAVNRYQNKQNETDPKKFNQKHLEAVKREQHKQKEKDLISFNQKNNEAVKKKKEI